MPEPPPRAPRVLVAEVPVEPVVMSPPEPVDTRSALDRAADWLREALTPDPVPATQIAALAETAQVKPRTLRRAYSKIGVQCFKRSGAWWWQLPDEDGPAGRGRLPAKRRRPAVNA
jgi:hypothetical protein